MSVEWKFSNRDRLFQQLKATVPEIDKNLRKALAEGGDEMVDKAQRLAPNDTGELDLSIEWYWSKKTQGTDAKSPAIVISAGSTDTSNDAFYARWVEFGTVNTPRQPFFFPSYRLLRRKIRGRMSRAMTKAIKNAGF